MKRAIFVGLFLLSNAFAAGVDFYQCSTVIPATDPVNRISISILGPEQGADGTTVRTVKAGVGRHVVLSENAIGTADDQNIQLYLVKGDGMIGFMSGSTTTADGRIPVSVNILGLNNDEPFDMNCQHIH